MCVFQVDPKRPVRIPGDSDASNKKRNIGQGGIMYTISQINWAVSYLYLWFYIDRKKLSVIQAATSVTSKFTRILRFHFRPTTSEHYPTIFAPV
jgi:hypothetical protein